MCSYEIVPFNSEIHSIEEVRKVFIKNFMEH